MGLGGATLNSVLGEPLRLSFPVALQPNEEVGCVQVRAKGDDLPAVLNTRSSVIRNGFQTRIEVTSAQPVNEPAIGIVVSVGCASPIAREYVLFLDPPIVQATESPSRDATSAAAVPSRAIPRRNIPRRRAPGPAASTGAAPDAAPVAQPTRPRRARTRPTPVASPASPLRTTPSALVPSAPVAAPPVRGGDRLTVAPTDAVSAAAPPAVAPAASPAPAPVASTPSGPPATVPVPVQATPPDGAPGAASPTVVSDREQTLRQQQADLQKQLKNLGDQIAALRVQTTTLATRNQVLEASSLSPWLVWMLIALAVVATLVAGWMAWRYAQLRRSMGDAAWWASNSVLAPGGASVSAADPRGALAALDPGTRIGRPATQTDTRAGGVTASTASATVSGSQPERVRAPARGAGYPAAMDTDFTVSDIEAAMATVRTVSPPRDTKRPKPLEDSDFAALGGPTQPSPFTQPGPTPRPGPVVERDEDLGKFVDLEIPPLPVARTTPLPKPGAVLRTAPRAAPAAPAPDEPEALDFKLDIPTGFDPLATDSLKTTVVDRPEPMDFDLLATPTALDFELPSATAIAKADAEYADDAAASERHGATALDDLFPSLASPGPDTILDLDDRDASPLSTTEVDRLTTTAVDGVDADSVNASTRSRLTRFADLMNQVDEAAGSDPLRAIAHLRQYVLRDEQIPTLLWLRLFELYRAVDKKPVYEALSEHFARRYHRPMVGWNETLADRVPQTPLAAMGMIDREIESLWGKEEGVERLRQLLCDRDQDDLVVFNAVLQRDLLDAAKVFPREQRA